MTIIPLWRTSQRSAWPNFRSPARLHFAASEEAPMNEHAFASATQLAQEVRDRRIGCLDLLALYLARPERYNPAINAVIAWRTDKARDRAREADAALARGEVWGPLHGVPMTVKESFNIAGLPTT